MSTFTWVLIDREGKEIRSSEGFSTKDEAESWMGSEWSSLREEGAGAVSLREDGKQVYRMSLDEA